MLYWMTGLRSFAAAFFTFLLISYVNALTMTQYFRAVSAAFPTLDAATKVSGLTFVSFFIYMGYMIAKPQIHPWLVWIFWTDPMAILTHLNFACCQLAKVFCSTFLPFTPE